MNLSISSAVNTSPPDNPDAAIKATRHIPAVHPVDENVNPDATVISTTLNAAPQSSTTSSPDSSESSESKIIKTEKIEQEKEKEKIEETHSQKIIHHRNPFRHPRSKYRHVTPYHTRSRDSCLSRETDETISFIGFRNLMVLVLVCMNLRLVIENFMKYGVLICIRCHDYRKQDIQLGLLLFALVPCHLLVAYLIELAATQSVKGAIGQRKKDEDGDTSSPSKHDDNEQLSFKLAWFFIAFAHTLNATACLGLTTYAVYYHIHHPTIGTICQVHGIIVWLKICSYAFTNRDLRHAALYPSASSSSSIPDFYASCPYPQNITVNNLCYFWLAPTLVYQPLYPRTAKIRWSFVTKRVLEMIGLCIFIWLLSAQYAIPALLNSVDKLAMFNIPLIAERIMKFSTISLVIWLCGFFAIFQSFLNALAEVTRFADRSFYDDWWNSPSVGAYWRTWNKPVYLFMKRHIYSPLVGRGWSSRVASLMVFFFSAVMHEVLVGIPTHNIIGVAFLGMMLQLPLMAATQPLEKMQGHYGKVIGNCIFWVSFCLVGQPLGALLYFFAWQAKYGSQSKVGGGGGATAGGGAAGSVSSTQPAIGAWLFGR